MKKFNNSKELNDAIKSGKVKPLEEVILDERIKTVLSPEMKKEPKFIECKCGVKVNGRSKAHAESLMYAHLNSRIHKERLDAINKPRGKK